MGVTPSLTVVVWIGVVTALMAALIALAQSDIKRILAYSTVSQLGLMMVSLGVGGVAAGIMHLLAHGFFKALLFLGSGSVIHGCHHEQDIHKMGGLRRLMPMTFLTYAIGMMTLSGVPLFFSGAWTKEEILHATLHWPESSVPALPDDGGGRPDRALHDAADDLRVFRQPARSLSRRRTKARRS